MSLLIKSSSPSEDSGLSSSEDLVSSPSNSPSLLIISSTPDSPGSTTSASASTTSASTTSASTTSASTTSASTTSASTTSASATGSSDIASGIISALAALSRSAMLRD